MGEYSNCYENTFFFWNLDDYPTPSTADFDSIYRNIKSALHKMGYHDGMHMTVACGESHHTKSVPSYYYLNPSESPWDEISSTVWRMCFCIFRLVAVYKPSHTNIMVIAKQNPENELHRVLQCLQSKNFMVIEPPADTAQDTLFFSVDSVVDCTQVFGGGNPKRRRPPSYAYYTEDNADNEDDA